jgi:hypothetical protein
VSDSLVELRVWSGCPSHERAGQLLRATLDDLGHPDHPIAVRWVETEDDASALGFVGSPTILVGGQDVVPPDSERPGLACRIYRRRDGRISPLPDSADLRDALIAHLGF